ncbi:restriction endonuclease subunit S [Acinetobacter baumannii]|uniref:restriction endonuclease subunit S n=1 Tax=Acinetobacter baumannii TaxID=470 RepID=UPI003AF5D45A
MSEWQEFLIEDLADFCNAKRVPLSSMQRQQLQGSYPYYGASGIVDYVNDYIFEGSHVLISEDGENLKSRNTPIAFEASGKFWVNNHAHILKAKELHLTKLIIHYFAQLDLSPYLTGAVQPKLNKATLSKIPLYLPSSIAEQKAIASVLSSLDDKIDLLHRQNKTLEAMAETLFRQWFIEEAKEDWEEVTLADVCTRITDGSHSSPASVEEGYPMASVKDMYDWGINQATCRKISKEDYEALVQADCKALQGDILIAKDGSYLKHVFLLEKSFDVVLLSSIAMLRPNGRYNPMLLTLFLKLDSTHESMQNIVTGAVIPRIVLKDFRKFPIQLPPKDLQDKAIGIVKPIFDKCWENNRQIQTLENLRDTLLPKLMSGEVRVQYQTEEVA